MEALLTYAQPFFAWLLESTMIASMVICLILTTQKLMGERLGPRWCHALWLVLLVRMVLPWAPSSRFSLPNLVPASIQRGQPHARVYRVRQEDISEPGEASEPTESGAISPSRPTLRAPQAPPRLARTPNVEVLKTSVLPAIRRLLPLLWLAGAAFLGGYLLKSNFALWRIVKRERPLVSQPILELFETCKSQMGVQTIVALVPSDRVRSAALFGSIRPRLLLPREMIDTTNHEELRYIFLHELGHLKRHDIYLGWLTSLLQVLHWFNPLVWLAFHKMRADRELACDALVLTRAGQDESRAYGRTMVGLLERFSCSQRLPAMAGILEDRSQLKRRIAMIAKFKDNSYRWSLPAAALIILLACVALPNPRGTQASVVPAKEPHDAAVDRSPDGDGTQAGPLIRELKIDIGWNTSLSLSRDGNMLAFCRRKNRKENIVVRNILTGQETEVTNHVAAHAWIPVFCPDGNQIIYTLMQENTNRLHTISFQTGEDRDLNCNGFACDWSGDGRWILVSSGETYGVLPATLETVMRTDLPLPSKSSGHRLSPDGRYVSYSHKGDLYLHPVQGAAPAQITEGPAEDTQPIWSADGKELVFLSRRAFGPEPDLCAMAVANGKSAGKVRIAQPDFGDNISLYALSETGRLLYTRSLEDCHIFSIPIDPRTGQPTGEPVRLGTGSHAIWSPDGKRIAYIAKGTLRVMSADGTTDQAIVKTRFHLSGTYGWAPDNDTIYMQEIGEHGVGISGISVSTKERRSVLPEDKQIDCIHLTCSPDGKWIAFLKPGPPSQKNQIFIVGVDGANLRQLTSCEDGYINYPIWSPDGKEIAFEYGPGGGVKAIMAVSVDDGSIREIFRGTNPDDDRFFWKSWSPDGSKMAWSTWSNTRVGRIADGTYEVFKVNLDDSGGSYESGEPQGPDWSPDGKQMLFFTHANIWKVMLMDNFLTQVETN